MLMADRGNTPHAGLRIDGFPTLDVGRAAHTTMKCLEQVVELRNRSLAAHSTRVGTMASMLALAIGLPARNAAELSQIAGLHDVGKLVVPDAVLDKPGPLTPEEWTLVKQHPVVGHDILAAGGHPLLDRAARIALHHHEAFDGSGYPHRLVGAAIPLEARITALCDIYDALREDRTYRRGFGHDDAVRIICKGDGRTTPEKFDPDVLTAFSKVHGDFDIIFQTTADIAPPVNAALGRLTAGPTASKH